MMATRSHPRLEQRSRGFGLVEIMVGVTIGLLALLIVYQVLNLSEGYRRTTMAGGDAQSSGMISSFVLAGDIANGGHTIAEGAAPLAACGSTGNFATTWRPIPVLITDGGADDISVSFAIFGGVNRRLVSPLDLFAAALPGGNVQVQSPLGFHGSHANEAAHMFVIGNILTGLCEAVTIGNWGGPIDPLRPRAAGFNAATGVVTITPAPPIANAYAQGSSFLLNLGANNRVRKVRYDVAGGVIRRTDLIAGGAPNPIVSNVALMTAQYGLDTNNDNVIDTWTNARNAPWRAVDVLVAPVQQLRQIRAIRIATVVRSSQFERAKDAEGRDTEASVQADFTRTLFDCHGLLPCSGEMLNVTIPGTAGYRYRVFEQVIPLTNQIWNTT
ncbi:MAG TPA: PilW family protein [Casimicrobiaceae bacterium]|nr:PilW family protein [Casimicrobiaceae bacterium]